jgi:hypothetical protein
MIRGPILKVLLGYLFAYVSLMLVRDLVTLRDIFGLKRLGDNA